MHRSATKIILNRFFASSRAVSASEGGKKMRYAADSFPQNVVSWRTEASSNMFEISLDFVVSFLFLPLLRLLRTTTSFSPLSKASFDLKSPTMMMSSSVFRRHHHRSPIEDHLSSSRRGDAKPPPPPSFLLLDSKKKSVFFVATNTRSRRWPRFGNTQSA